MRLGSGHGATSDSFDPGTHEHGFTIAMSHGYNGYLTEVANDGSLVGQLAESWEASVDVATWTFQLRKGVTYHDGREVTAEDVIASINHHRGEKSTSAAKPILAPVADMKADWRSGIGAGAYKVKSFEPGVRIDLEKYADYWDSGHRFFDAVTMITMADPAARTNAIITGEVHAIDRVDLKTAQLLGRRPGIEVHSIAGTQHYTFPMRKRPVNGVLDERGGRLLGAEFSSGRRG